MPSPTNTDTIWLGQIAHARSGDKGNHANIGVVAYTQAGFEFLVRQLTAERVKRFFEGLGCTRVERYELPKVQALNFVLYDALAGGASQSLRIDSQGKLLGTAILDLALPVPADDQLALMLTKRMP
ncbi:MAG TPA: hypothetical protein VGI75_09420 [Pirellulales bacterium]|jgi:hypothetical protein